MNEELADVEATPIGTWMRLQRKVRDQKRKEIETVSYASSYLGSVHSRLIVWAYTTPSFCSQAQRQERGGDDDDDESDDEVDEDEDEDEEMDGDDE